MAIFSNRENRRPIPCLFDYVFNPYRWMLCCRVIFLFSTTYSKLLTNVQVLFTRWLQIRLYFGSTPVRLLFDNYRPIIKTNYLLTYLLTILRSLQWTLSLRSSARRQLCSSVIFKTVLCRNTMTSSRNDLISQSPAFESRCLKVASKWTEVGSYSCNCFRYEG